MPLPMAPAYGPNGRTQGAEKYLRQSSQGRNSLITAEDSIQVQTQARVVALQEQLTDVEREKLSISSKLNDMHTLLQEERSKVRDLQNQLQKTNAECDKFRKALQDAKREAHETIQLKLQLELLQQDLMDFKSGQMKSLKQNDQLETRMLAMCSKLRHSEEEIECSHREICKMEQQMKQMNTLHDKMMAEKNAEIIKLLATVEALNAELNVHRGLSSARTPRSKGEAGATMLLLSSRLDNLEAQLAHKQSTAGSNNHLTFSRTQSDGLTSSSSGSEGGLTNDMPPTDVRFDTRPQISAKSKLPNFRLDLAQLHNAPTGEANSARSALKASTPHTKWASGKPNDELRAYTSRDGAVKSIQFRSMPSGDTGTVGGRSEHRYPGHGA